MNDAEGYKSIGTTRSIGTTSKNKNVRARAHG